MENEKSEYKKPNLPIDENLFDPDPMSVFLGILGALGSVASLLGYLQYERDKRKKNRDNDERDRKKRNEILDQLMALEVETLELRGLLQGLEIILVRGTEYDVSLSSLEFQFGGINPLFTYQGYKKYDETMIIINRKCGKMIEQTSNLMQNLFYFSFDIEEGVINDLINLNNRLNGLLRDRTNYEEAFKRFGSTIEETMNIIRRLREIVRHDRDRY